MAKVCAYSDIVITTAQVFGRKAPIIVTKAMVEQMRPGSIIVDMAVDSGGNVEGSRSNEEVVNNGVIIIGHTNLPGRVAVHASQMYSSNVFNLVDEFWDNEKKAMMIDQSDEIIRGCLITSDGDIVHETIRGLAG